MEAAQDTAARPYLGASQVGHPCARNLFYSFRWAEERRLPASALRAIEDGFRGEDVMAARLRMVPGIKLNTVDPITGKQFAVEALGGHFRGHLDGIVSGLLEAPKTLHVWEHKQVNEKKFAELKKLVDKVGEKAALAQWDEVYHHQAIVYMALRKLTRHFLTVGTPGGREYVSVRTEADPALFDKIMARAELIVNATEPPLRISEDPAWFVCRWCPYHAICHGDAAPLPNCRTCAHSTPVEDSAWRCAKHDGRIPLEFQRLGCSDHLYLPPLLEKIGKPSESDGENFVEYEVPDGTFRNGGDGWTSVEIRACQDKRFLTAAADMPDVQKWRKELGAQIVR